MPLMDEKTMRAMLGSTSLVDALKTPVVPQQLFRVHLTSDIGIQKIYFEGGELKVRHIPVDESFKGSDDADPA